MRAPPGGPALQGPLRPDFSRPGLSRPGSPRSAPARPGRTIAAALAAGCALLSACTPAGPDRAASEVLEEVLESHRASIAGLGLSQPGAPQPGAPQAGASQATPAARRPAPGSVAALVGQTPAGVLAALGQPTRRRPEGEAEIWLYQGANCALDVVLYREAGASRVAWAAARASGTERRTEAGCLLELTAGYAAPAGRRAS